MNVTVDHATPLHIAAFAIRQCWQSQGKSDTLLSNELPPSEQTCGPNDLALIDRIGNKFKHASTLEHITFNFTIRGVSRALLQELARHRMASPSVKSTRYTLKELKDEEPFMVPELHGGMCLIPDKKRAAKYLVYTGIWEVDEASVRALETLRQLLVSGIANDKAKYCLPESYKTDLAWTINARSLQNFLSLRSSKAALWEIRQLAQAIFDALPGEYKYLFEDHINKETNE
jgi:thymidylate synthase (FAD)